MESVDRPRLTTRTCFVCGQDASFGFTSRPSDVWTCMAHRNEGDKRLVAPAMSRHDKAAPGRSPGGPHVGR